MTKHEAPQMNRNLAAVLAIFAFANSIIFGVVTSARIENGGPVFWPFVASMLFLLSGMAYGAKARR